MKERIIELFQDYGTISTVRKIKLPGRQKIMVYAYSFEMSNLMQDADDVTAKFILVDQGDLVSLAYFGVSQEILDKDNVLSQLNYVNAQMLYGKFLADDDNDVHWEYSFEPSKASKEDVLAIIRGFINGLSILLNWNEEEIDEQ